MFNTCGHHLVCMLCSCARRTAHTELATAHLLGRSQAGSVPCIAAWFHYAMAPDACTPLHLMMALFCSSTPLRAPCCTMLHEHLHDGLCC
jgi:hypothetical protein